MSDINLNKPHITVRRNDDNTWDVSIPRGNLIVGATAFETYKRALEYAEGQEPDLPIRTVY